MDQVSIDAAEALSGEEAFILQLRPPAPPGGDEAALADRIDQFTALYLGAAGPTHGRYAQLAPLTWAIAAPRRDADAVETLRGDLCETLFGDSDPARIHLARQPKDAAAREPAFDHPSAASRAAFEDDADVFDLDNGALHFEDGDVLEVDAWRLAGPAGEIGDAPDRAAAPVGDADPGEDDAWTVDDDAGLSDVQSALAELEQAFADDEASADGQAGADGDAVGHGDLEPVREAGCDTSGDAAVALPDEDGEPNFDTARFEADLDAFEAAAETPTHDDRAGSSEDFDALTEAPAPRSDDVAAELAAFRAEMRAIAETIPAAGAAEAVSRFREEIEAVTGALGQRVDGAAQRIEAAADRMMSAASPEASDRLAGAAQRAETASALMESSVQEAVRALQAVLQAAGAGPETAAADG